MKKKTVVIFGASGYLGSSCVEFFKGRKDYEILQCPAHNHVNVSNAHNLLRFFDSVKPDIAINLTGAPAYPTIDWCETHKEATVAANVVGPEVFATICIERGIFPVQIASGCIYEGGTNKRFTEEHVPNFTGSFYSRMRIAMEMALKELPVLILRIRMPLSTHPHPRNYINKIASYKKVISVANSVTLIEDLWPAMEKLIKAKKTGIFNMTNTGYITNNMLLAWYKAHVNPKHKFNLITPQGLRRTKVKTGRSNCVLSTMKAKAAGAELPELTMYRLDQIMREYKNNLKKNV